MKLLKKALFVFTMTAIMFCACAITAGAEWVVDGTGTVGFYDSESYWYRYTEIDGDFFVGGGRIDGWDYKSLTIYTNMKPSMVDPDGDGPKMAKKGKITAVVTSTPFQPAVKNGKIAKDKEAEKVMKASYSASKGKIKLTANKKPGKVYLHLLDIDCNKNVAQHISLPVTVGEVCKKIEITDANGNKVKKVNLEMVGWYYDFNINTSTKSGGIANDSCIEIYDKEKINFYSKNGASAYLDVDIDWDSDAGKGKLRIYPKQLKNDKYGNPIFTRTSFAIWDSISGKKATIFVTICDAAGGVECFSEFYNGEWTDSPTIAKKWLNRRNLVNKNDVVGFYYKAETFSGNEFCTDNVKIYVCKVGTTPTLGSYVYDPSSDDYMMYTNGKLTYTKSSDVKATLKNPPSKYRAGNSMKYIELKANIDRPNCDIYSVHTPNPGSNASMLFFLGSIRDGICYDKNGNEIN